MANPAKLELTRGRNPGGAESSS